MEVVESTIEESTTNRRESNQPPGQKPSADNHHRTGPLNHNLRLTGSVRWWLSAGGFLSVSNPCFWVAVLARGWLLSGGLFWYHDRLPPYRTAWWQSPRTNQLRLLLLLPRLRLLEMDIEPYYMYYRGIYVNPLMCTGSYSASSSNMKLVHWPLMDGLLHFVQRRGDWAWPQPTQAPSRCTKCISPPINGQCTNHRIVV